jgi:hypothetical protein
MQMQIVIVRHHHLCPAACASRLVVRWRRPHCARFNDEKRTAQAPHGTRVCWKRIENERDSQPDFNQARAVGTGGATCSGLLRILTGTASLRAGTGKKNAVRAPQRTSPCV